jgi:hypothetical protein
MTFKWKWKGYIVNWVTRYQCYEMVFGDNQVCLPAFQFVCSRFKTQLRPAAASAGGSFGRRQLRPAADGGVQVGRRKIWPVRLHGVGCYDGNNILFVSIWHPDYRPCWSRHNFIPLHNKFKVIEFYPLIRIRERVDLGQSLFIFCLDMFFEQS